MARDLDALEHRTKQFTIDVVRLCNLLEGLPGVRQLTWQLVASAGSVGSNHRAMRRARSTREFAAKLQIVNEEIDESVFWLQVISAVHPLAAQERMKVISGEAVELRNIFARARGTLRRGADGSESQD